MAFSHHHTFLNLMEALSAYSLRTLRCLQWIFLSILMLRVRRIGCDPRYGEPLMREIPSPPKSSDFSDSVATSTYFSGTMKLPPQNVKTIAHFICFFFERPVRIQRDKRPPLIYHVLPLHVRHHQTEHQRRFLRVDVETLQAFYQNVPDDGPFGLRTELSCRFFNELWSTLLSIKVITRWDVSPLTSRAHPDHDLVSNK